jgi:hypothetical protein
VYIQNLFYASCLIAVKFSILILYLRILSSVFLHRLCYAAMGIIVVFCGFTLITCIAQCVPVARYWDYYHHLDGWCWPSPAIGWANVGIHLFTETMILVLPMPFLFTLNIPWSRKIGIMLLFALGAM